MASSLTLLAAMVGAWLGLGPGTAKDLSAMSASNQTSGLAREDRTERGSRSGAREKPEPVAGKAEPEQKSLPGQSTRPQLVPDQGSGKTQVAFGGTGKFGDGPLIRYRVEVERELPFDSVKVAGVIDQTLRDKRSWAANGWATFQRVDDESADLVIVVATPRTTDDLCHPLETAGKVSCRNGGTIALNADRWNIGAEAYGNDVDNYRHYLVNHEVGHFLGLDHIDCSGKGRPAPVMMQQTKGVGECVPNSWPLPSEL